ncbi:Ribosomal protein S14, mitochondrial [Cyberlindnera fabianii]|uniref:37S ribosomal protein MRP2, mitochondrial n=1 Tax=Cyberlindnera fabianii TaxID=36022 RepID=A0A1V2L0E4_CYBFA|nr:Ribosomal protein S14, mitochondrial [Cyberlindnera fabianii]
MGAFRFPVKFQLPTSYTNARVIRDHFKRQQAAEHEVTTQALKYIARNTALPARARLEAQLQLTTMPNYTRMTAVKDRCVSSGHARGVIKQFRTNRYQFREMALAGELPGVRKGSW